MRYVLMILILAACFCGCTKVEVQTVDAPQLLVSSKTLTIGAAVNSAVTFSLAGNVDWTITSDQSWLTIDRASGKGEASIVAKASANTTSAARTAQLTIKGTDVGTITVVVSQDAFIASLAVSTGNVNLSSATASDVSVDIKANLAWTASSSQSWLKLSSTSGTGDAKLVISASTNTAFEARSASVTISAEGSPTQTIVLSQAAAVFTPAAKPNWTSNSVGDFQYSMTFVCSIQNSKGTVALTSDDELAAFIGTECRAVAKVISYHFATGDENRFLILVKGNQLSTEKLIFKCYSKTNQQIYESSSPVLFIANQSLGSPDEPYSLVF